ncbi:MAG: hypothetical protein ABJ013_13210 [Halioglobus sp.]
MRFSKWQQRQSAKPLKQCQALVITVLISGFSGIANADQNTVTLPAWETLEFEQKAFMTTAKSKVDITPGSDINAAWTLRLSSSIASNSEEITLTLDPASGRSIQRSRLSRGTKEQRYKAHEYKDGYVVRERRVPGSKPERPPAEWDLKSRMKVAYPNLEGVPVSDPYFLLLLAGEFQDGNEKYRDVLVNTDRNFFSVRMTHAAPATTKLNYRVSGQAERVKGKRPTRAVSLAISPVEPLENNPDFSLLGLSGDITVLFDEESGIPVQLQGRAPRVGSTKLNLKSVTLRPKETTKPT